MQKSYDVYILLFFVTIVFFLLYIPIGVLVLFSCNEASFSYVWKGFTLKWYYELWHSVEVWDALKNSFIVAASTMCLSIFLGLLLIFYSSSRHLNRLILIFYGCLAAPEIVVAVSALTLFVFFSFSLGLTTLIAVHTLLGLSYVVPILYSRFSELDYILTEASLDLGASPRHTLWYVILPLLGPTLFAAGLVAFVISWDDFVISFFCSGPASQTLPMYIFSMIRSGTTPTMNALSTVLLFVSSILVLLFFSLNIKKVDLLS